MTVYTVHARPASQGGDDEAATIFVPEAFSRAAFILGPIWLAWARAWVGLVLWLLAFGILALAAARLRLPLPLVEISGFILAGLTGLEANNLRRAALERRGFGCLDVVSGVTVEDAERAYFSRSEDTASPARREIGGPFTPPANDVGSLFPSSGSPI